MHPKSPNGLTHAGRATGAGKPGTVKDQKSVRWEAPRRLSQREEGNSLGWDGSRSKGSMEEFTTLVTINNNYHIYGAFMGQHYAKH